ncbi:MAG TPA: IS5 family transposase [Gaiellaceae bacterium]
MSQRSAAGEVDAAGRGWRQARARRRRWARGLRNTALFGEASSSQGSFRNTGPGQPRAGEKGGSATGPSPVDRARLGSKHHLLVEGGGIPLAWALTGGNRHDSTQLIPLVDRVPPVRGKVGRPRRRPDRVTGDRAYNYPSRRRELRQRGIKAEIARRNTEHGSGLGRYRWVVERTFAWLHQFKRLLVRYDRRHEIHEAFLALGCCLVCFRRLSRSL